MRKSIIEYVATHAKETPETIAIVIGDRQVSYSSLFEYVEGFALYLQHVGLKKGDIVVVKSAQTLWYVVSYLGIHLAGGVITGLEKNTPAEKVRDIADKLKAAFIISDTVCSDKTPWIQDSDVLEKAKEYYQNIQWTFPKEDDSADILFTTGTTGDSKGVELSHKALTATAENLIFGCGYLKDIVMILPGPLNHANAIRKLYTTFVNGSTIIILDGMTNIKSFFDALDYSCDKIACCLPPAAIRMIFSLTGDKIGEYAEKIDFIESASAPLPEGDKEHLCNLLPKTRLYNLYGSSESASVCMYDYNQIKGKKNCIGKAMPNSEIIIVDENKNEIHSSSSRLGFIACKGDVNMKGYVGEPELTRTVLLDGIVYTNDVGYIDEEGFVYTVGRKGDVINVGGMKVAPAEVESVALMYKGIDDCICIPIKHAISGQALKLLFVSKGEIDIQDLRKYMMTKLEMFKVPDKYEKVDYVERTYNGKLNRKAYAD